MIAASPRPATPVALRRLHLAAVSLLAALLVCLTAWGPPIAAAEPPSNLRQQLTDSAGVLGGDSRDVESRLAELRSTDQIQLWVTFVDTLDGIPVEELSLIHI